MKSIVLLSFYLCVFNLFGQDSIVISNTENNYVFEGLNNIIKFSEFKDKHIEIEGENCSLEFEEENVLSLYPTSKDSCFVIFIDTISKKEIKRFSFIVKKLPPVVASLGGIQFSGQFTEKDLVKGLVLNFPNTLLGTNKILFKVLDYQLFVMGGVVVGNGSKFSEAAVELINNKLKKGDSFSVVFKYSIYNTGVRFGSGTWVKNY